MQIYHDTGNSPQRWNFYTKGSSLVIKPKNSTTRVLDVYCGSNSSLYEKNVQIYDYTGDDNQLWVLEPANLVEVRLFACSDGITAASIAGHAFLKFKNLSNSNINIGYYELAPDEEVTIGTWGDKSTSSQSEDEHYGICYNYECERYWNEEYDDEHGYRVSVSIANEFSYNTANKLEEINDFIYSHNNWSYLYNCSSFAADLWNLIFPDMEVNSTWGGIDTPTVLRSYITNNYTYDEDLPLPNNNKYGYYYDVSSECKWYYSY